MKSRKSIFITGAASGIGRATALLFAEKGWYVGLFDVSENGLQEVSEQIGPEHCCYQKLDVSKPEEVDRAITLFSEKTGNKMHVLFNSAGLLRMGFFDEIPLEEHSKLVQVNVLGVINCIHASIPLLKETPESHIVNMSSSAALYGTPEMNSYSATKFAIRSLTESLNIELERFNITVSDVMPPGVHTPMLQQNRKASLLDNIKYVTPEEVAEVVWKAAHGKQIHWIPWMKYEVALSRLFPSKILKLIVKQTCKRKNGQAAISDYRT